MNTPIDSTKSYTVVLESSVIIFHQVSPRLGTNRRTRRWEHVTYYFVQLNLFIFSRLARGLAVSVVSWLLLFLSFMLCFLRLSPGEKRHFIHLYVQKMATQLNSNLNLIVCDRTGCNWIKPVNTAVMETLHY